MKKHACVVAVVLTSGCWMPDGYWDRNNDAVIAVAVAMERTVLKADASSPKMHTTLLAVGRAGAARYWGEMDIDVQLRVRHALAEMALYAARNASPPLVGYEALAGAIRAVSGVQASDSDEMLGLLVSILKKEGPEMKRAVVDQEPAWVR